MTRKKWIAWAFIFLVILLLLEIFVGSHGLTYIISLRQQVADLSYQVQKKQVEVDALSQYSQSMGQGDGIKDAAFKLGYQSEGEQVYFFDQPGRMEIQPTAEEVKVYHYFSIPFWGNVLIALFCSFAFILLYCVYKNRRKW